MMFSLFYTRCLDSGSLHLHIFTMLATEKKRSCNYVGKNGQCATVDSVATVGGEVELQPVAILESVGSCGHPSLLMKVCLVCVVVCRTISIYRT